MKLFELRYPETGSNGDFNFQSENFMSANRSHAFYIGVKKINSNEVRFNCVSCDDNGNKLSSLYISRHRKITTVYNDLAKAAENGLDTFIALLKNITISDDKLRSKTQFYAEDIEEAMSRLEHKPDDRNNDYEKHLL